MKLLFPSLLLLAAAASAQQQSCTGFKPGAEEHVSVSYSTTRRRGETQKDVKQAVITWRPQEMLSDLACYDLTQAVLLYREAGDEAEPYAVADVDQRPAGQAALWTVPVKPCLEYQFAIKVTGDEADEATFELPQTVGPASEEEILNSKYTPAPARVLQPDVLSNSAVLNWDPSVCAQTQEIYWKETGSTEDSAFELFENVDAGSMRMDDLKPCTSYDVQILSVLADSYATAETTFSTKPRLDAATAMNVDIKPAMTSVEMEMEVWQVPCITEYELTVCRADDRSECHETQLVTRTAAEGIVTQVMEGLSPCTEYVLEVQPLYPGTDVEKKEVSFKTLSPSAASSVVGSISATAVSTGSVQVNWPPVTCAADFVLYQRKESDSEWEKVEEVTDRLETTVVNLLPCTRYTFAVAAKLNGEETELSAADELVTTFSEEDPFEAPNLAIGNADDHAVLSWDHAVCIESYRVRVCPQGEQTADCSELRLDEGYEGVGTIEYTLTGLSPCTVYSLEVIPIIPDKTFTARPQEFTTTNGTPQAPNNVKVQLITDSESGRTAADLTWEPTQCATGYKVISTVGSGEPQVLEVTKSGHRFDLLQPCLTYSFSVATLVVEQESEATKETNVLVPPAATIPPVLKLLSNENKIVTLKLTPDEPNSACAVAEYEVGYSADGAEPYNKRVFHEDDAEGPMEMAVEFDGASSPHMIITGRVRYADTDVWSEVVSSREPGDRSKMSQRTGESGDPGAAIVPIIIGAIVGLVLLVLIVVFLVRKRRARDRYDAEKAGTGSAGGDNHAGGPKEETQKLNESHPDA